MENMKKALDLKKKAIYEDEERFAYALSEKMFEKPQANVWMILIPIIIVYHMYRHQQYISDRKSFSENYLLTRKQVLDETFSAHVRNNGIHADALMAKSNIPGKASSHYKRWVELLSGHYRDLLKAEGDSYDTLTRNAYGNRTHYLLFLHQLNRVENRFNTAVTSHMEQSNGNIPVTLSRMARSSENLRRDQAEKIFC